MYCAGQQQREHLSQVNPLTIFCLSVQRVGVQGPPLDKIVLIFLVLFVSRQKEQESQQYNDYTPLSQLNKWLCELRLKANSDC